MHTDALALELEQMRRRAMSPATRALELEQAILRVEGARLELRAASTKSAEEQAKFHLKMAAGHLSKLTKLHPGLPTWTPPKIKAKKKPKKHPALVPLNPSKSHLVYQNNQRSELRGKSERRFVDEFRPGQEVRGNGGRRRLEVRNITGGSGTLVKVEGEPIKYRSPYKVADRMGEFQETMLPGVAAHLLGSCDCRFLFGHSGMALARTTSGTLKLTDTPTALRFSVTVDTRQKLANDLVIAIERGDISQMSVGFVVDEGGDSWSDDYSQRQVSRFRSLEDISAVTFAASPLTSISLAGAGAH